MPILGAVTLPSLRPHLDGNQARGLIEGEPIAQFELGALRNFVYLIVDWQAREAAIVDPQKDLATPLGALNQHGIQLTRILLPHTHHDHVAGVPELARTHPLVPVMVHEMDLHRLHTSARIQTISDRETLRIGHIEVQALHTPGHSAGECCYLIAAREGHPPYLFTGDTLFIRDCGRTDQESGSTGEMFASLQRIKTLDHSTVILPGHHYKNECASTMARELAESAPLQCASVAELDALH